MKVNGTLVNYYFHCRRQCYLFGNRMNMEDNSEEVKIGKAIHEERNNRENTELAILTGEYLTELKKSDADHVAAKWQLLYYLKVLKEKGIERKGKLEFAEKNKTGKKTVLLELTEDTEKELLGYISEIEDLLEQDKIPAVLNSGSCKKCAYYEYCYI